MFIKLIDNTYIYIYISDRPDIRICGTSAFIFASASANGYSFTSALVRHADADI